MQHRWWAGVVLLFGCVVAGTARADGPPAVPSGSPRSIGYVEMAQPPEAVFTIGLFIEGGVQRDPAPGSVLTYADHRLRASAALGISLLTRLELGAVLPVTATTMSNPMTLERALIPGAVSLDPLHLSAKLALFRRSRGRGIAVALRASGDLPLIEASRRSDGPVFAGADLVADARFGWGAAVALNAGVEVGCGWHGENLHLAAVRYAAGVAIPVGGGVSLIGDVHGRLPLSEALDPRVEILLGVRRSAAHHSGLDAVEDHFTLTVAAGGGVGDGLPAYGKLLLVLQWSSGGAVDETTPRKDASDDVEVEKARKEGLAPAPARAGPKSDEPAGAVWLVKPHAVEGAPESRPDPWEKVRGAAGHGQAGKEQKRKSKKDDGRQQGSYPALPPETVAEGLEKTRQMVDESGQTYRERIAEGEKSQRGAERGAREGTQAYEAAKGKEPKPEGWHIGQESLGALKEGIDQGNMLVIEPTVAVGKFVAEHYILGAVGPKVIEAGVGLVGAAARAASKVITRRPLWLSALKGIAVDMEEILTGHVRGGSRASSIKDLFPPGWGEKQIKKALDEAWKTAEPLGSRFLQKDGEKIYVKLTTRGRGGIKFTAIYNFTTKMIETAYPAWRAKW